MNNELTNSSQTKSNNLDLSHFSYEEIFKVINKLTKEERKKLLCDYRIKEYIQNLLLSDNNTHDFYNQIFKYIDFSEIKEYFNDYSFVEEVFQKPKYTLFASALNNTNNKNELLDIFIDNEALFYFFAQNYHNFYSIVENIDNQHLKKLIDKIIETDSYKYFKEIIFSKENEDFIMNEDYNIDIFVKLILNNISLERRNNFFQNDPRAELVIPYLDASQIDKYAHSGIIFGNKIIKNPKFFELLKSDSLIKFRQTINNLLYQCNDPHFIEEKVRKYYDTLIYSYQKETGLFKDYHSILENNNLIDQKIRKTIDPFLLNMEIDEEKITKEYLQKETSLKISELIIESLFNDNIYNVHLNIKELLRYSKYLDEHENSILSIEFYKVILDIDSFDNDIKINLYNSLKDTDIKKIFYEDLRKIKDIAYKKINDKLINPMTHTEYINQEESIKNGTVIYDLREKEFNMLVRVLNDDYSDDLTTKTVNSYSLISNNNTEVFHQDLYDDIVIYGYNNFDIQKVRHMSEQDSFTTDYESSKYENTYYINRIATSTELADTDGFSEILIQNEKIGNNQYKPMKPSFIVAIDEINKKSINASRKLNIPIVIIKSNKKTIKNTMQQESYVDSEFMEKSRRSKR